MEIPRQSSLLTLIIPAKAGIQGRWFTHVRKTEQRPWIPAFAGMTSSIIPFDSRFRRNDGSVIPFDSRLRGNDGSAIRLCGNDDSVIPGVMT
jgi:hypothetical protein